MARQVPTSPAAMVMAVPRSVVTMTATGSGVQSIRSSHVTTAQPVTLPVIAAIRAVTSPSRPYSRM